MLSKVGKILFGNSKNRKRGKYHMEETKNTIFVNRELSWLKFNERVLEQAKMGQVPLCERLTFLSIFQSNLDEFFMVRVGSLEDQKLLNNNDRENKTNMTPDEQLVAILERVNELNQVKDKIYKELMKKIEEYGVDIISFKELSKSENAQMRNYFNNNILPLLSVMIVGRKQPFPFLKGEEIYAMAILDKKSGKERIGIIPCNSEMIPRMISVPGREHTYMLREEVILHYMNDVFNGYKIKQKSVMRVTRNADIDVSKVYDEDLDYRDQMAQLVKLRKKLAPVRLELTRDIETEMVEKMCEYLELEKNHVLYSKSPLDLSFVFKIEDILRGKTELFYEKKVPQPSTSLDMNKAIIPQILEKDVLLSYPYESIRPFLQMLHEAARDPKVQSIRMTLYRLAKNSKVVEALVEAAENGKQVDVLVELKARFDEANNIDWSRTLEDAGCHVVYGVDGLKVHSKLCLITRKTDDKVEYITQIGTGNYNEKTARLYTDLSLITSREDIGIEAREVFQEILIGNTVEKTQHLLVAPKCLQKPILDMIDYEIEEARLGKEAYIGVKVNSLTDKKIIDKLVEASKAGVKIDMVVRGICCLKAGVEGETENIHIRSIVGRYLEHSRIYIFGPESRDKMYIASADFMTRNTLRRVEVAAPIYDEKIKDRIRNMFKVMLMDNELARIEGADGIYRLQKAEGEKINSQEYFNEQAYEAVKEKNSN